MNEREVTEMMQAARRNAVRMWQNFLSDYKRRPGEEENRDMMRMMIELQQPPQESVDGENLHSQIG